ncbi:MAG: RNA polymerase sigma factor [Chitinispirillaceae bacterium]|nr:RNA polymerase sigma factor [Chitinispirillaceae bacterium]
MAGINREGEKELRVLYERYAALVHARCRSILRSEDEAWDATQEVFMKLYNALPSIKNKEVIYSWLLSTSTNYCISELRKRRSVSFNEEYHRAPGSDDVPHQEKSLLLKEVMQHFFAPWDHKVREVVMYAYFDGYRQEEIAGITGLGASTIRKYLTKFKRKSAASGLKFEEVRYG